MFYAHAVSATCIITVGLLAMLVIYKNKKLHHIQGIFRFNLAVSDCLTSVILVGSMITPKKLVFSNYKFKKVNNDKLSSADDFFNDASDDFKSFFPYDFRVKPIEDNLVGVFFFICYTAGFASVYSYFVMSLDRFAAIRYPFKYKRFATKKKAHLACALVWFSAALLTLLPLLNEKTNVVIFQSMFLFYTGEYETFFDLVYHVIPVILCWALNIATLTSVLRSERKMKKFCWTIELKKAPSLKVERRVGKVAKTIAIMVVTFTVSFMPYNVYNASLRFAEKVQGFRLMYKRGLSKEFAYLSCVILLYNNFWNFFIYQIRDPSFRSYTKLLLLGDDFTRRSKVLNKTVKLLKLLKKGLKNLFFVLKRAK